jgi:hypothetical protein
VRHGPQGARARHDIAVPAWTRPFGRRRTGSSVRQRRRHPVRETQPATVWIISASTSLDAMTVRGPEGEPRTRKTSPDAAGASRRSDAPGRCRDQRCRFRSAECEAQMDRLHQVDGPTGDPKGNPGRATTSTTSSAPMRGSAIPIARTPTLKSRPGGARRTRNNASGRDHRPGTRRGTPDERSPRRRAERYPKTLPGGPERPSFTLTRCLTLQRSGARRERRRAARLQQRAVGQLDVLRKSVNVNHHPLAGTPQAACDTLVSLLP